MIHENKRGVVDEEKACDFFRCWRDSRSYGVVLLQSVLADDDSESEGNYKTTDSIALLIVTTIFEAKEILMETDAFK